MIDLHHLKRFEHYLTLNNGVLLVAVLVTIGWLWGTISAIQRNFILEQQAQDLRAEISLQALQNQNAKYQQMYYKSTEYLELSAREHFDKASPGESEILLPPNTVSSEPRSKTTAPQEAKRTNFEQWLSFLFGRR